MKFPFKFKRAPEKVAIPVPAIELEGLDAIDWVNLEHAYGSAADIPDQLRALASRDKEAGDKAIYSFYGNIYHQGTTYQATSYAVPFFQQILRDEQNPHRADILTLLVHLAFGTSYHNVHQSMIFFEKERDTSEFQEKVRRELDDVERARLAVEQGVSQYLGFLNDDSADIRARAIYLASLFGRQQPEVIPALWKKLETETNDVVRASLWLGLVFGSFDETAVRRIESAFEKALQPLEKWALAVLILKVGDSSLQAEAVAVMIESLDAPEQLVQEYGQLPSCNDGIVADSAGQLLRLGLEARKFSAPLCAKLSQVKNQFAALGLLESVLPLFFGEFSEQKPVRWSELDEHGREVLRTLAETDGVWGDGKIIFGNLHNLLRHYGLPDNQTTARALVENSSPNS